MPWRGKNRVKLNYFGIVAAALAFASLALSWLTVSSTAFDESVKMEFTAYLYQIQGTVNDVSASTFANVWFVVVALGLMGVTAAGCLAGSALAGRRGKLLLLVAGISALLAMVVFGAGLLNSDYANTDLEPGSAMALFPTNTFAPITIDIAMEKVYDFAWGLGYGFWLSIGAAIVAFIGAVAPTLLAKKPSFPATEPNAN